MAGDHLSVNAFPGISSRDLASGPAGFKQHKFWQADLRSKLLLKGPDAGWLSSQWRPAADVGPGGPNTGEGLRSYSSDSV